MNITTAEEARAAIAKVAERNKHDDRVTEHFEVGKVIHQGDVYLHMVAPSHPHGAVRTGPGARQLAQGDNVGARHIAEPPAVVYEGTTAPPGMREGWPVFLGPVIEVPERTRVTHPKHGAHSIPVGTYQVTHQMDARTGQRTRD